jgi:hypothetical protein
VEDPQAERAELLGVLVVAAAIGIALVTFGPDHGSRTEIAAVSTPGGAAVTPLPATTTPVGTGTGTGTGATATTASAALPTTSTAAATDPGALPQTDQKPVARGATFDAGVQGLWQAVAQDDPDLAMPFFFPKAAYLQVKAISDPASDYEQRLIANYRQDVHALHAQLGSDAASAQFAGIDVPDGQAVLVQPGEESNKLSYWRVYGTTLRYAVNGTTASFPVTSLISWRGEWYVVHLGEIR